MTTQWVTDAARNYGIKQKEEREQNTLRLQKDQLERHRLDRIAAEGKTEGTQLWEALQRVIKSDVAEFNDAAGYTVLQTKALGDGTFEVHSEEHGRADSIASLSYAHDTTTLSWKIFGGVTAVPLKIGLEPNQDIWQANTKKLQFTNGNSYYDLEQISQQVLTSLLF
jgi:hypothetical protein